MSSGTKTTADYIQHHLTNLTYGQLPDGSWGFARSAEEAAQMGFWSINVDSMAWSIGLGLVFTFSFVKLLHMPLLAFPVVCKTLLK